MLVRGLEGARLASVPTCRRGPVRTRPAPSRRLHPASPSGIRRGRPPRSCQVPRCRVGTRSPVGQQGRTLEGALGSRSTRQTALRSPTRLRPSRGSPARQALSRPVPSALDANMGSLAGAKAWVSEAGGAVPERLSGVKVLGRVCYLDREPSSLACAPETGPRKPLTWKVS